MKKKSKQKFSEAASVRPQAKKLNPFEVHINRKKYDILGMKSKAERGLPGVSRARSLAKRKGTLLQEYKYKDKKNLFLDKRIGERNSAMTAEDKILARYTAERMKFHSKKSIYNLGDDEELTHKGQTLTEIEKFDDPKSEDEDDEEEGENGKLDSDFVGDAHFGGGIFKKVEGESKSRKDLIQQLISESIKRKAEKQKLKQQTIDLTQKLDSEWKELLPLVTASKKSKLDVEPDNKKDDKYATYDIWSKKLKFEARGKPSDRLKSEEEIAKEEKEKLEQLERDRIQRMLGENKTETIKHRSADDMDDGFDLSIEPETFLTYKDGVLDVDNKDGSDSDDEMAENIDEGKKKKKEQNESDNDNDSNIEEQDEEDTKESENEDNESTDAENDDDSVDLSDLKESDESDDELQEQQQQQQIINSNKDKDSNQKVKISNQTWKPSEESENDATEKEKAMEAARKELPYTFNIPEEYEEFEKLMNSYNSDFQAVIIERMIKCNHPSLNEKHKEKLDLLYTFLLQHIQDCASDDSVKFSCFKILDRLAPWLFDLTQWNPESSSSALMEVIKEKYHDFLKKPKTFPSVDTLIFLKLVSLLFPTSDFRHDVVTPSLIFMQHMLFQCKVQSSIDLSTGLFLTSLLFEYCALSKRFVPEAINFIYGVLRLVHPKNSDIPVRPPFQVKSMDSFNLNLLDKSRDFECTKMSTSDLILINSSEEFKINSISLALNLLSSFCDFWKEEQPAILLFEPFIRLLDTSQFSDCLKRKVEEVLEKILNFKKNNLKVLALEKKRPKPLRLYEPNIEEVYSLKKYRPMGKKKAERAKLVHKYKKEMKGALREIRRDRSFLAKLKFKETIKSDIERERKVREIFNSAAEQAGELRKLQKKKKRL